MATAPRHAESGESCHRCGAALAPRVAYCESCGQRTRRAARAVRFWARLEIFFLLMVVVLVIGFTIAFYIQR
jgi:uncharacterized OB-fold protein